MTAAVSVRGLRKNYKGNPVFSDFSIDFAKGEITSLFGRNGAGKSTLLNILSGVTEKDGGSCDVEDRDPFSFSYIFQNYRQSLLPWRSNFDNVALPLEIQGKDKKEIEDRIGELQALFGIRVEWKGYPYALSGGQQQMLAFMRALATRPKTLFIDEPFSALDYENNLLLREYLLKYYMSARPTVVLITHNIEEAAHLSSKIAVLSKKPTRVVEVIDNPAPYPRTPDFLKTPAFDTVKDKVLSVFLREADLEPA